MVCEQRVTIPVAIHQAPLRATIFAIVISGVVEVDAVTQPADISPAAIRAVREQQQRTANKKASRGYDLRFHEQSTTKINVLGKLKARPNPVSEFTFVALRGHFELAHQFKCFVALTDLVHRQAA